MAGVPVVGKAGLMQCSEAQKVQIFQESKLHAIPPEEKDEEPESGSSSEKDANEEEPKSKKRKYGKRFSGRVLFRRPTDPQQVLQFA